MIFHYVQSEEIGGTFGNKDDFKGVGIVFDTYDNDGQRDNPAIFAISSDGTLRFDHERDGAGQKVSNAQCNLNYRNPRVPVVVKISYQDLRLKVMHDLQGNNNFVDCFHTSPINLPDKYYIGITAHTGQVADNHDIYFLKVTNLGKTPLDEEPAVAPPAPAASATVHQLNESAEEQHKWKPDDDRHLARYADSIVGWAGKSPEERERLAAERRREFADRAAASGSVVAAETGANGPPAAAPIASGDDEKQAVRDAVRDQQHFRDEVSATLAVIQAEVKAIAHEMRGTITLAHALPQGGDAGDAGAGAGSGAAGGGSASEVISSLSDVIQHMQRALSDDVASTRESQRALLESLQRDQRAVAGALAAADRARQESRDTSAGLSRQLQELRKELEEDERRAVDDKRRRQRERTKVPSRCAREIRAPPSPPSPPLPSSPDAPCKPGSFFFL